MILTWELVGIVIGAGLASGREIAEFFSQYGHWGYAGILMAGVTLIILGGIEYPITWNKPWQYTLWNTLIEALLIVTGGAMLSVGGRIVALVLPYQEAAWCGLGMTLLLAWLMAAKTNKGLIWISRLMLLFLGIIIFMGVFVPRRQIAVIHHTNPADSVIKGLMYGGFNAVIQVPVLIAWQSYQGTRYYRRSVVAAALIICLMIAFGHCVISRNPGIMFEELPFLMLVSQYGKNGYYMAAFSLYMAALSTLTACIRSLKSRRLSMIGVILISQLGFSGAVKYAYPVLGSVCSILLLWAKFRKSAGKPFQSLRDVI